MAREVDEFSHYIVDVHSDHRITAGGQRDWASAKFAFASRRSPFNLHRYPDPYFLLTHAQYDEVNCTANNNWQVVRSGQGDIIPLLDLIGGFDA